MIGDSGRTNRPDRARPDYIAVAAVAVFAYFVLVSELGSRDIHAGARVITGLLAAAVVLLFLVRAPERADGFDRRMILALILFLSASIFSRFPRQTFDSVLLALLYVAALFLAREVLARESARRISMAGLMVLSALLTITTSAQFVVPFVEWWALTDWTVSPPLDLRLVAEPWGYRHDMTLLLVLLYPSWWVGRINKLRIAAALIVGLLTALVAMIDGSRTIWLAAAGGAIAVALPVVARAFRVSRLRVAAITALLAVAAAALTLLVLGTTVGERIFRLAPVAERATIWNPLLQMWTTQPLVGSGPGSFPWLLQLTDYFDTHSFAPRHADSAVIQLVVETGILGLGAAFVLLATVVPAVIHGQSRAARFALTACLISGLTLNPTQLAFVMAVAIGWVAFGVPRQSRTASARSPSTGVRAVSLGSASILGVAYSATVVAGIAYSSARDAVSRADFRSAAASLELAATLDPSLAIYQRQLGSLRLMSGAPEAAITSLGRATELNGSDDLAWRVLGLAHAQVGDWAGSMEAVKRAVDLQRSDPTNLLLLANVLRGAGHEIDARAVLAEIIQAWPLIVAAPEWKAYALPSSTTQILAMGRERWTQRLPSPEPLTTQRVLLAVMTGLAAADLEDEPARISPALRQAYVAVMRCDVNAAAVLNRATPTDRRQPTYWALEVRLAKLQGVSDAEYVRLYRIMTGDPILSDLPLLNPLHENGTGVDLWGYRRPPIFWPDSPWDTPSPRAGFARWHRDPGGALREADLEEVLNVCAAE